MTVQGIGGILLMAIAGLGEIAVLILSTLIESAGLPSKAIMGIAFFVMSALLAVVCLRRREICRVKVHQWKWVILRGTFGCATFVLLLMGVAVGAPMGDVSALTSVNVVAAALLGRVFLGERLKLLHVLALLFSLCGAVLVSNPQSLLAMEGGRHTKPWLGYAFGLGAGVASGCLFIASRKSQGISPLIMSCSCSTQAAAMLLILSWAGGLSETMLVLRESSSQVAGLFTVLLVALCLSNIACSWGSQLCPAAASSTVYTSTCMLLGYIAQVALYGKTPAGLTILGAVLMLIAVILMASARLRYSQENACDSLDAGVPEPHNQVDCENSREDDTESLASFVASEFSGVSNFSSHESSARKRHVASFAPPLDVIGVACA